MVQLELLAAAQYTIRSHADTSLGQRVIMAGGPAEARGLEDLRLVRFTEPDGATSYRGTYTAFDGTRVAPAPFHTSDFITFDSKQPAGDGAQNKGMALFPRAVAGRYLALSRWDRKTSSLAESADLSHWDVVCTLQQPTRYWQVIQVGNRGSPLETAAGWLVLTYGVVPMRQYGIGAMLLDLGTLEEPLLTQTDDEREGYVPNVVHLCGAMSHGRTLVLPYGCSDSSVRFALVDLDGLLSRLPRCPITRIPALPEQLRHAPVRRRPTPGWFPHRPRQHPSQPVAPGRPPRRVRVCAVPCAHGSSLGPAGWVRWSAGSPAARG